ncbi:MAG: hypothetical protein AAGG48_21785 [Planctomycetota bacterium]
MTTAEKLSDNTPVDPDDELLVAYLDGELSRQDQAELEDRLMADDGLRQRLQQLQNGWELLDALPDPEPSLKLVESTLEMVVADILKDQPSQNRLHRFRFPGFVALACVLGVGCVLAVSAIVRHQNYRAQLTDLAIVENIDAYLYGSDLNLMRQLTANPDWLAMVTAATEMGDINLTVIADVSQTAVEERDELIRSLPPESIDQLNSRWERFKRMEESDRDEIRQTAAAVEAQPDAESLLRSMQSYAVWRESLPAKLRDGIEQTEGSEQRNAIEAAIEHTQLSISRRSSLKLTDEAVDAIYIALQQILDQRLELLEPELRKTLDRFQKDPTSEFFMLGRMLFPRGPGGGGPGRGPSGPRGQRPNFPGMERTEPLTEDELQLVRWVLPDRAVDLLDLAANGDPFLESVTLRTWAEESLKRKFPRRRDEISKLERYLEIPDEYRDQLDMLPPDRFLKELSRDFGRFPQPRG